MIILSNSTRSREWTRINQTFSRPAFGSTTRKRIALQFLYGLNFIHSSGHFHRDLSTRNVLLKTFGGSAVLVKLSDFGLAKRRGSDFTLTETELKGTKIDPALGSFKDFSAVHDIFAAGFVLLYIFTGRFKRWPKREDTAGRDCAQVH